MAKKKTDDHNSIKGQIKAMDNAKRGAISPPDHIQLREIDWPFWNSIVLARPVDQWDHADLEVAAMLAMAKADFMRHQKQLDDEGPVIRNDRGTPITNPLHNALETLSRRIVQLSRVLHVHPEAKQGASRQQGKKLQSEKQARQVLDDIQDDELLGGMRH